MITSKQATHYAWMLKNLTLNPKHRAWIEKQISEFEKESN